MKKLFYLSLAWLLIALSWIFLLLTVLVKGAVVMLYSIYATLVFPFSKGSFRTIIDWTGGASFVALILHLMGFVPLTGHDLFLLGLFFIWNRGVARYDAKTRDK